MLWYRVEWSGVRWNLSAKLEDCVLPDGVNGCLYRQLVSLNSVGFVSPTTEYLPPRLQIPSPYHLRHDITYCRGS